MMTMERNSQDGAQLSPTPQAVEVYPSGNYVDLINPNPDTIELADIVHHLSMCVRYAGGVSKFYSVAEHSVFVHDLILHVPPPSGLRRTEEDRRILQLAALFHDAAEAYIGDMTAPCKFAMRLEEWGKDQLDQDPHARSAYDYIGDKMDEVICEKFGLEPMWLEQPELRIADLWAMRIEARALTRSQGSNWRWPGELPEDGNLPRDVSFTGGMQPESAKVRMTRMLKKLGFTFCANGCTHDVLKGDCFEMADRLAQMGAPTEADFSHRSERVNLHMTLDERHPDGWKEASPWQRT